MVKLFLDILHGIKVNDVTFTVALEFGIFLGFDGQLKQNSDLEMELFTSTIKQLRTTRMTKIENALAWLYLKSWENFSQHVLDVPNLWNFGGEDLEAALTCLSYENKNDQSELCTELKKMIMERFDNNTLDFVNWSRNVHKQVSDSIVKYSIKISIFKETLRLLGTFLHQLMKSTSNLNCVPSSRRTLEHQLSHSVRMALWVVNMRLIRMI